MANKNTIECDLILQRTTKRSKLDQYRTEIETLLADGSTQKSIAKRFGTSEENLRYWMNSRGIKISQRTTKRSKLDQYRTEIETLLTHGSTQRSIAKRFGTTRENLRQWMNSRGIKRHRSKLNQYCTEIETLLADGSTQRSIVVKLY